MGQRKGFVGNNASSAEIVTDFRRNMLIQATDCIHWLVAILDRASPLLGTGSDGKMLAGECTRYTHDVLRWAKKTRNLCRCATKNDLYAPSLKEIIPIPPFPVFSFN